MFFYQLGVGGKVLVLFDHVLFYLQLLQQAVQVGLLVLLGSPDVIHLVYSLLGNGHLALQAFQLQQNVSGFAFAVEAAQQVVDDFRKVKVEQAARGGWWMVHDNSVL